MINIFFFRELRVFIYSIVFFSFFCAPRTGELIKLYRFVYLCNAVACNFDFIRTRLYCNRVFVEGGEKAFDIFFALHGGVELDFNFFAEVALKIALRFKRTVEPRAGNVERVRSVVSRVKFIDGIHNCVMERLARVEVDAALRFDKNCYCSVFIGELHVNYFDAHRRGVIF